MLYIQLTTYFTSNIHHVNANTHCQILNKSQGSVQSRSEIQTQSNKTIFYVEKLTDITMLNTKVII